MVTRMSKADFQYLIATTQRRRMIIKDHGSPEDSTTGEESPSDTTESFDHHALRLSQMSSSACDIVKAIRYMRDGDQNACFTALSSIMSLDFTNDINASAVMQEDGVEMFVNMLEVNHLKCRMRALQVMKQLTQNKKIVTMVVLLGIAPVLVNRLIDDAKDEVALACDVIANIAHKRRAARAVRKTGGISILVSFLDLKKDLLVASKDSLSGDEKLVLRRAKSAGRALWQLSKYSKIKTNLVRTGLIPIMATIMLVGKRSLFIPLAGVLCEATTLSYFQLAVESEGLVGILLHNTKANDPLLQRMCCRSLMQAARGSENVRDMIRFHEGPEMLVRLLVSVNSSDKPFVAAIIGAIWTNAISIENAKIFQDLGVVEMIMRYLNELNVEVAIVSAGALTELGKVAACRREMVRRGAVPALAALLSRMLPTLLPNVASALRECAKDEQGIKDIVGYDLIRRLWTLLTHSCQEVRVQAARALDPCIRYAEDSGEVVRNITNSLLLLLNLLKEENVEFLQAVCAMVTLVALDEENLTVMTEQGVASLISTIILREDFEDTQKKKLQEKESRSVKFDNLEQVNESNASPTRVKYKRSQLEREQKRKEMVALHRTVASAIANCCTRADNRHRFGSLGVIPRLVQLMEYGDALLQAQACRALHALSFSAANCVSIHSCNAVPLLLRAMASCNEMTQLGAAGCMYNLRNLLLRSENDRLKKKCSNTLSTKSSSLTGPRSFL